MLELAFSGGGIRIGAWCCVGSQLETGTTALGRSTHQKLARGVGEKRRCGITRLLRMIPPLP